MPRSMIRMTLATTLLLGSTLAAAQQDLSRVEIQTTKLTDSVYMLTGAGGNLGVSIGDDGVFVIDDQFAPLSEKLLAAIGALSDKPVSYVVNTHWHGDHTGGNENFGKAGAVIVAHENVRVRMSTPQFMKAFGREVPAAADAALPVVTFTEDVTFHFNGEAIHVRHQPNAHTDGDATVLFETANILHLGDTFFNGFFPFIDQSSGGSLAGVIAAAESALDVVNDSTVIIPGHGPLGDRASLETYLAMLQQVASLMQPLIDAGQSRDEVLAANPLGELGNEWGNGFMKTEVFTGIVYDVMSAS